MGFKVGGLINRLSQDTKIYRANESTNEIGEVEKSFAVHKTIKMYITSTGGNRSDVAEKPSLVQMFVGQTTELNAGIQINDILSQGQLAYRVEDIDENAANVSIQAEYKLSRVDNLQDLVL